ncbi:MAG TPA: hypothetical protein VLH56_11240 [Dissulfurispiraceae bacterium]|nr:hypothetical protein [Dissulfurispiraceae bacterium]
MKFEVFDNQTGLEAYPVAVATIMAEKAGIRAPRIAYFCVDNCGDLFVMYDDYGHYQPFYVDMDRYTARFEPDIEFDGNIAGLFVNGVRIPLDRDYNAILAAARKTLADNRHLADGENCTLKELRDAVEVFDGVSK